MPGQKAIERQNQYLLRQQRNFRVAADHVAAVLGAHPAVSKVVLFGSVAVLLWKEVPRFPEYRRARIEVWHECKDVDLAVWVNDLRFLPELRKLRVKALQELLETRGLGVAVHQVEVFLFGRGAGDYLGRLCYFNRCPKGNRDCDEPGCGRTPFLKQMEGFKLYDHALAPAKTITLYPAQTEQGEG